jgi:hypothetical protein
MYGKATLWPGEKGKYKGNKVARPAEIVLRCESNGSE